MNLVDDEINRIDYPWTLTKIANKATAMCINSGFSDSAHQIGSLKQSCSRNGMKRYTNNRLMKPFKAITAYITFTLFLSFFGPTHYQYSQSMYIKTILYMVVFLGVTWLSMLSASQKRLYYNDRFQQNKNQKKAVKYISMIIVLAFLIKWALLISVIQREGMKNFREMGNIFTFLAKSYTITKRDIRNTDVNIFRQIDSFFTFLNYIAIYGGLYIWKHLHKKIRFFWIVYYLANVIYSVFYLSTLRAILDLILAFILIFIVNDQKSKYQRKKILKKINRRKILIYMSSIALVFLIANILFSRTTFWGSNLNDRAFNYDSVFLLFIPTPLKPAFSILYSYLSQGYYGLALCLELPFKWTYGLGSAIGLTSIISDIFPSVTNIYKDLYILRAEAVYGYDGWSHWHTVFSWLANDFTFLGALVYMGIFANIFMKCWKSLMKGSNPISYILLNLMAIQYIFIIANNQLLQDRGSSLSFVIIFFIWLIFHNRYNFTHNE
jgi:hypothetical protein